MNEFNELRKRAREKRDKSMDYARHEYEATLVAIASLERGLLGQRPIRYRSVTSCVESVIPTDRPFTSVDIMASLKALDSGRIWCKRTVDSYISILRRRGLVRRVRRSKNTENALPAVYARVGVEVPERPFGDLRCVDVIRAVLTKPMNTTELTMAMLDAGYDTVMKAKALRYVVGEELRKGGFKCEGGKWAVG